MNVSELLPLRLATDAALGVLVEGSLMLGATWLVVLLLRRHAPATRHTVWTVGFTLALLVPVAATLLPERSLGLLTYPRSETVVPAAAAAGGLEAAAPFPGLPAEDAVSDLSTGTLVFAPAPSVSTAERLGGAVATTFLVLWALGAAALLARLVGHRVRVGRLTRRGTVAPPGDAPARLVRREARRMGIGRRIGTVYTAELPVPVTWGVLRPVLLLPPEASGWSETRLQAVVVHELAHIRRWDALSQQLAELARALYWANPLVWIGRRRAARERENACDDEVLRSGMARSDYAAVLVEMARLGAGAPARLRPELEGGLALAGPSRLQERVGSVLDGGTRRPPRRAASRAAATALVLVAAPLAGTSLVTDAPSPAGEDTPLRERLHAVEALGVACDETSFWSLARVLQEDPAREVRKAAARALATRDDPRSAKVLSYAAGDAGQDASVRRAAMHALGSRDSREAAEALLERLRDHDAGMRRAALRAMADMDRQSRRIRRPVTMVMLKDPDPTVRAAAARTLRSLGCHLPGEIGGSTTSAPSRTISIRAPRGTTA